ncbi:hypothetical protein MAH1_33990 [Sessilibacter sp. MAH1]
MNKNEEKQTLSFENLWDMYESFRDEKNKLSDFALNFATRTTTLFLSVPTFLGVFVFLGGVKVLFDLYKDEPLKFFDSINFLNLSIIPLALLLAYLWTKLENQLNYLQTKIETCNTKKNKLFIFLAERYPHEFELIREEESTSTVNNHFISVAKAFRYYLIILLMVVGMVEIFAFLYLKGFI